MMWELWCDNVAAVIVSCEDAPKGQLKSLDWSSNYTSLWTMNKSDIPNKMSV